MGIAVIGGIAVLRLHYAAAEQKRMHGIALLLLGCSIVSSPSAASPDLQHMHNEFTFIDPRIIASQSLNLVPELGAVTKSKHNPLLSEQEPYDGNWLNSNPSIVYQNGTFHLWWTAKLICPGASPETCTRNSQHADKCCHPGFNFTIPQTANESGGLLYASSTDGVTFVRPKLGLNELLGNTQNNAVFVIPGHAASQVGVFYDESVQPGIFRAFGKDFPPSLASSRRMMGVASSHDGLVWTNWTSAGELEVNGDTSNNALFDPYLKQYLAFSRLDNHVNFDKYGLRKETISSTASWDKWSGHTVCMRGTASGTLTGEIYSLVPFRLPSFAPGLYLGLAAFYDERSGIVTNELLRSTTHGHNWTRLSPGKAFIPHGKTLDNFTTYAARALLDPHDPSGKQLLMYYAGGDGPHSGRRRDYIMLATTDVSEMVGVTSADNSTASIETIPLALPLGQVVEGMNVRARFKNKDAFVGVTLKKVDGTVCAHGEVESVGVDDDMGATTKFDGVQPAAVRWSKEAPGCNGEARVSAHFELHSSSLFGFSFY